MAKRSRPARAPALGAVTPTRDQLMRAIRDVVATGSPGAVVTSVRPFAVDEGSDDSTEKAFGYGEPLLITVEQPNGRSRRLVLHTAQPGDFGHDRRADRAAAMLLAFDTYGSIPRHVAALDVGALGEHGHFMSLRGVGELYLLTSFAEGHLYAEELRDVALRGACDARDRQHVETLARYLADLHVAVDAPPQAYTRAIRDLVGHGEGVFGIVDGYPPDEPAAPPERLAAIEQACLTWRWRLKGRGHRLRRTHGDFHPFNILFDDASGLSLLDTSRGSMGDPADDLAALAINYPFFALQHPGSWDRGYRPLWRALWRGYFEARRDDELLDVVAPFVAWRALVVANPRWYPKLDSGVRDRLLGFAERALATPRFDPDSVSTLVD